MEKSIVIKLGGSLLYDMNLNIKKDIMSKILNWYSANAGQYKYIVFIIGGGKISRHLVSQVKELVSDTTAQHRIGMEATRTNAAILAGVLGQGERDILVPTDFGELLEAVVSGNGGTIVSGGFKVGWSSDMNAAIIADVIGLKKIYKLSDIDHIYTADPDTNPDATPIQELSWSEYFKMFGISMEDSTDTPGKHVPIGTHAAQFCVRKGMSFFVSGGSKLNGESDLSVVFESGTYVHP